MRVRFFAEKAILDLPEADEIAQRYPIQEWIEDYQTFRRDRLPREKECVLFAKKRGVWLKPFHCYDSDRYRYVSLDGAEGCRFDCVYCYLQSYLNHGALVLFVDYMNLQTELQSQASSDLWISTGLLSDSLLAESYFPVLPQLSRLIPNGSVLELRSKSADLTMLKNPAIEREPIVVAWSLNPQNVVAEFEYRTAPLQQRLDAARQAIAFGYRVAFHFDPVFYFKGWRLAYQDLLDQIKSFPPDKIAFLSLGLFRYMPELGAVIRARFPFHSILTGEFLPERDGKYHYFRAIRKEMYQAFSEWLKPWKDVVPILWSMEPDPRLIENRE